MSHAKPVKCTAVGLVFTLYALCWLFDHGHVTKEAPGADRTNAEKGSGAEAERLGGRCRGLWCSHRTGTVAPCRKSDAWKPTARPSWRPGVTKCQTQRGPHFRIPTLSHATQGGGVSRPQEIRNAPSHAPPQVSRGCGPAAARKRARSPGEPFTRRPAWWADGAGRGGANHSRDEPPRRFARVLCQRPWAESASGSG